MLARWLSVLTAYDFEIVHRRGSKHGNSDALSRKPRHCKCKTCPDCTSDSKTHCAPVQKKRKGRAQKRKLPPQRAEVEPDTDLETSEDDDQLSNWPCFKADVERWCRQCRVCQQKKPGKGPGRAKLKQEPVGVPL